MAERHHDFIKVERGGKTFTAAIIRCGVEGCTNHDELYNTNARHIPPEQCTFKWKRKGWFVGRNAGRDRCPEHNKKGNAMGSKELPAQTREVHETHSVDKGGMVTMRGTAPLEMVGGEVAVREMDREDRRLIYGELDLAYLDAKRGYKDGNTDESVAKSAGVPVAWVRKVREEMFGPAKGDEYTKAIAALFKRLDVLEPKIKEATETLATLISEAHTIRVDLNSLTSQKGQ